MAVSISECSPLTEQLQQPARSARSHGTEGNGREAAISYSLPLPFPDGKVWAAIKDGRVADMVYMAPVPAGMSFSVFRQRSREKLAKAGVVWTGCVAAGLFIPEFETTDVRHTGRLNTARVRHG